MIKSLSILNYALIQELELLPASNLNVITGETGAGKSIMLGAIGLLMGNRADAKALWDESKKCHIEGVFSVADYNLAHLFDVHDLDYQEEIVIRREITPNGKSRAFINDTTVTLDVLKLFALHLMDIHSQHESLHLSSNQYQLNVLDQFSLNAPKLQAYLIGYRDYQMSHKEYDRLLKLQAISDKDQDYNRFILTELEEAKLELINVDQMEQDLMILQNTEEIKSKLALSEQLLDQTDSSIIEQLAQLQSIIKSLKSLSPNFTSLNKRIESNLIELKDITKEINNHQGLIQFNPERMEELGGQLSTIYRLQQKHGMNSIEKLIELRNQLSENLKSRDQLKGKIIAALEQRNRNLEKVMRLGQSLSKSRLAAARQFEKEITKIIRQIGIENGQVNIQLETTEPNSNGLDVCQILFSANKGIEPKPLKIVASGGELSRLIFAIKYLIADKTALPTLIFDEIDTGVSGEIAIKMIKMMKSMAQNHQVIAISHLPQFAAGGDAHFFVYKDHHAAKSVTKIKQLNQKERIEAIAKMIAGDQPTDSAFKSAYELLSLPI